MTKDDETTAKLKPAGWEEYETPKSQGSNWASEQAGYDAIKASVGEFKSFMEDNFIKGSNSPILSKGTQIIIEKIEELPLVHKQSIISKLKPIRNKLNNLKTESQDSFEDFTNQYVKEFQNIANVVDTVVNNVVNKVSNKIERTTCTQKLQELINSEKEKEEIKVQKEREDWNQKISHGEWVETNVSPKVKLVLSIEEALKNAPKIDLASLAQEAQKETKQAKKFMLPSVGKTFNKAKNALSIRKNKNNSPQIG